MREEDVGMTRGALIQSLDILFGNSCVHRLTNVCFNKVQMRNLGRLTVSRCSLIQEEQRVLGMFKNRRRSVFFGQLSNDLPTLVK